MASRALPGIGLNGFWDLGEDGWKNGMDANLLKLSSLLAFRVLNRVDTLPGAPSNGDIYIVTSGAQAQNLAVRDNGAWTYYSPNKGWRYFDVAADTTVEFDGTEWVEEGAGGSTGGLIGYQVFTADGAYDKTVNNPAFVIVEVQAGGGAGGSGVNATAGSSSFGSHCSATGGARGGRTGANPNAAVQGGAGGTGTGGDLNITGGAGGWGICADAGIGSDSLAIPGRGGDSVLGLGANAPTLFDTAGLTVGDNATGFGGGGSGRADDNVAYGGGGAGGYSRKKIDAAALASSETVTVGAADESGESANGSAGIVIVWEYQ